MAVPLVILSIFCFIFSLIWRDVLPCLGVSKPPKECIVSLEKDKSLSSKELQSILNSVVEKLDSKEQPIYLCHNKGCSFSIKRGYKDTNFSTGNDIVCSIYGYLGGQILIGDDRGTTSYNTFLITGNYFISKKRTERNRQFFDRFLAEIEIKAGIVHIGPVPDEE